MITPENARVFENKERLVLPVPCTFGKFGGTWDMIEVNGQLVGTGRLDDATMRRLEIEVGEHLPPLLVSNPNMPGLLNSVDKQFAESFYYHLKQTSPEAESSEEHLGSWCPDFGKHVTGPFYAYYSGDSSHLRAPLTAPIVSVILDRITRSSQRVMLGAQGTDTADIAVLTLLDALTFDTQLPPIIFTGANRSHREPNSDAPRNFRDLARCATIDLPPGAYWVFHGRLFSAADFVKINPLETRTIEGQSTFFSPHKDPPSIDSLFNVSRRIDLKNRAGNPNHISQKLKMRDLYAALNAVYTIDLGDQNRLDSVLKEIADPANYVIILEAHSLGNVSNIIRDACIEVSKRGKVVVLLSRSLIGDVNTAYGASLINPNRSEVTDPSDTREFHIISGGKLNRSIARALAARALLESPNDTNAKLSKLITDYQVSRQI